MKSAIIGSTSMFIVALLLGLVSKNSLPIVLLRSVITAGVAFGAMIGISFIVKRFLPELTQSGPDLGENSGEAGAAYETVPAGQRVNLVVSDDDDEVSSAADETEGFGNLFEHEAGLGSVVQEVTEEALPTEIRSTGGTSEGDVFEESTFYDGMENLPDIAGFESSFATAPNSAADSDEEDFAADEEPGTVHRGSKPAASGNSVDPEVMARAISTALKRST